MLLSYAGIAATMHLVVNCDGTVAGERYDIKCSAHAHKG